MPIFLFRCVNNHYNYALCIPEIFYISIIMYYFEILINYVYTKHTEAWLRFYHMSMVMGINGCFIWKLICVSQYLELDYEMKGSVKDCVNIIFQ